jgi:hypothetical protein
MVLLYLGQDKWFCLTRVRNKWFCLTRVRNKWFCLTRVRINGSA